MHPKDALSLWFRPINSDGDAAFAFASRGKGSAILLVYHQMETMAETNRILQSANNTAATEPKKTKKVKKKKVVSSRVQPKRQPTTPSGTRTSEHYRLHLAEIPFVAGTVSVQLAVFADLLESNGN